MATTVTLTNEKAIEIANLRAKMASETKSWRLRDNRSREFKALAEEFLKSGKCYIVATEKELAEKYPNLHDGKMPTRKYIWGIHVAYEGKYVKFSFEALK